MKKNNKQWKERQGLVQLVFEDPKIAAEIIRLKTQELRSATNVVDRVKILSELLYISESTIYRDYAKTHSQEEMSSVLL